MQDEVLETALSNLKLVLSISLIVGVYLILNFPVMFVTFYHQTLGYNLKSYNYYSWAETIAFLNSCSNLVILFLEESTGS